MADDATKDKVTPEEETSKVEPESEAPADDTEPETPVEETPEEPEEPEAEAETPEEEPKEEEKPPSRRESLRIQQLVEKLKEKPIQSEPKVGGIDYETALDADPEVIKQLEDDRRAAASSSYQQGIEQAKSIQFHTRLEIDAPKIETKYPIFNKESEDFKPDAANAINSWYLATVGYDASTDTVKNPNVRYSDFVEGIMELADNMAGTKVESTTKNIAKQAAMTGLRPDGSSAKRLNLNKAPQDMTDEELSAVIGQALPK